MDEHISFKGLNQVNQSGRGSPRRHIVDLNQFEQSLSNRHLEDAAHNDESTSQFERLNATQIALATNDHSIVSNEQLNSNFKHQQRAATASEMNRTILSSSDPDKQHNFLAHLQHLNNTTGQISQNQQQLSRSYSIPIQPNDADDVTLDNNKLWKKQFVQQSNSAVRLQRPSNTNMNDDKVNHSGHGLC